MNNDSSGFGGMIPPAAEDPFPTAGDDVPF